MILAAAVATLGWSTSAQPGHRDPYSPPSPFPGGPPGPGRGGVVLPRGPAPAVLRPDGGDPRGRRLVFTNERGTPAEGWVSRDGRRVTIPGWNLTGSARGDAIVWPNGDFWGR